MGCTRAIQKTKAKKSQRKGAQKRDSPKENTPEKIALIINDQEKDSQENNTQKKDLQKNRTQKTFFECIAEERQKIADNLNLKKKEGEKTADKAKEGIKSSETKELSWIDHHPSWDVFKKPAPSNTELLYAELLIGGPIEKFDLDREIEKKRKQIEERYEKMCREDNGLNPGMPERIKNFGLKNLKRYRENMESINWRTFFKGINIPWPDMPRPIKTRITSQEEKDEYLCGH